MAREKANRMGEQSTSSYQRKRTSERLQGYTLRRIEHSPDKKSPHRFFRNRYLEYTRLVDRAIPLSLFEDSKKSKHQIAFPMPARHSKSCAAAKLSTILTNIIREKNYSITETGHPGGNFINRSVKTIRERNILDHIDDTESIRIYIIQMLAIMRAGGFVGCVNRSLTVNDLRFSSEGQYTGLFASFWNKIGWDEIFMSMPEFALGVQKKKEILTALMLRESGRFRLDRLCNRFFRESGTGTENDLLMISFLDFYVFTWLGHFGIINFPEGGDCDPVMAELTGFGREFLKLL